jgi:NAD(P)-dependent dehydrogenase (short-subunit alcohol dehydrogenase family)
VTAAALAEMGAHTVLVCRDPARGEAARAGSRSGPATTEVTADRRCIIAAAGPETRLRHHDRYDRLDVLVSNAGA